jgi:HEAT repeat protein
MRDEDRLALMLGRLVELLQRSPDMSDDHKAALDSLGQLTSQRSWSLQLKGTQLSVEGGPVPPEVPLVSELVARMRSHGAAEIHMGFGAAGLDIMLLVKALVQEPREVGSVAGLADQLRRERVRRIWVLGAEQAKEARASRQMRTSEALEASGMRAAESMELPQLETVASSDTAAERMASGEALPEPVQRDSELPREAAPVRGAAGGRRLVARMAALGGLGAGEELARGLSELTDQIVRAGREGRNEEVAEALVEGVRQEEGADGEDVRRAYGVALRRMLGPEVLRPLADLLLDPLYAKDVMVILRRAGKTATQLLLDLLVAANTFAERRAFMAALREMGEGTDNVISMLSHHQWYVVRNVADLVGELKIEEAIPALGEAANHVDARVRSSVGIALVRIGTRATARYLRSLVRDADPQVRRTVVRELGGAGLGALVGTLINQADEEEDDTLRGEHYRALGRIGTTEAVQALAKVAHTRGGLFGKKDTMVRRAAVEGLILAGSDAAKEVLRELSRDRDKDVKERAQEGLRELSNRGTE